MLSLISTLGGLLISGLPKLLEYFQNKADQKHELALAAVQKERDLAMAAAGFAAQMRVEEIRTEQVAMQTDAQMTEAALAHDAKVLEKASTWVSSYVGTVRPTVTYIFVIELVLINLFMAWYLYQHPGLVTNIDDVIKYSDLIFSSDEMAMLGGIVGFWFGSRNWDKKAK
jgi:predicted DNA repair protein MutK